MRIIDNKQNRLIEVLESMIDSNTNVYYVGEYVTAYSLFSLYPTFNTSGSVKLLLDYDLNSNRTDLLHNQEEEVLNLNLDRKMKVEKVIKFLKDKSEIRKGSIGNQNLLIIDKGKLTKSILNFEIILFNSLTV